MESTDELVQVLYCSAAEGEWQPYRARALARVCEHFGLVSAAWWTRGVGTDGGEVTQHPQPLLNTAAMAELPFADTPEAQLIDVPGRGQQAVAVRLPHRLSSLVSTLVLQFPNERRPDRDALLSVLGHLLCAGTLALRQFVRRDDWLQAMGRANRGSAAMVDAEGTVFEASQRFREMLDHDESAPLATLPFELPESVFGDGGGEFMHGAVHLRVRRAGQLYQIYARKPLPMDSLSPREQEIARALGNGKTLKSIARQYGIAVSTVANHTTRIYRKLQIYRREDLIELLRLRADGGGGSRKG